VNKLQKWRVDRLSTLVCKNRQYFRSHGILLNSASNSLSYDIVRFKIEMGVDAKFICKDVTRNTQAPSQIGPPAAAILDSHSGRAVASTF